MSAHKTQEYKGNGNHAWETVCTEAGFHTQRLRVPGGWIYRDQKYSTAVFVPLLKVIGHAV